MKTKRQTRESKNQKVKNERRNRIRGLLIQFGLWAEINEPKLQNYLLGSYNPPIEPSLAEGVPVNARTKAMLRELNRALQAATFDCSALGTDFSAMEYFSYLAPLAHRIRKVPHGVMTAEFQRKLDEIESVLAPDVVRSAMEAVYNHSVRGVLTDYGRLDEHMFYVTWMGDPTPHGRLRQRLEVNRVQPECRFVTKNGEPRRAYRCGFTGLDGIVWIDWPSSMLGLESDDRKYPVFVQAHAVRAYLDRIGQIFSGNQLDGQLQDSLALSLIEPKLLPHNDGTFLAECHLGKHKVGYLVARKLDELILIETFLFLTMDGTPEGIELKKQWKLERSGKQFTGLDQLATFLLTDVANDPDLVRLLGRCGCGHLFEMSKDLKVRKLVPGYAADIRKYLRMKS